MRALMVGLLLLGGCSTMREAAGAQRELAEKGIGVNTAAVNEAQAPAEAAPGKPAKSAPLPGGLGGDKEHAIYAPVPPKG